MAGLKLDPWQELVLVNAMGERADGRWAALEVGLGVPRQNGKGGVLEARELAGLFLLDEQLLIHSAHEFKTAEEALLRMEQLLEGCPDLSRQVRTIKRSHGQEGVYLKSGARLRYATRTKGGGRGFSCDWLGLDEAFDIPDAVYSALLHTMSAMDNPQWWFTGSAVDQETMDHGLVFARVRERGVRGDDPRLMFMEWSAPFEHPDDIPPEAMRDPEIWAQANPALGIRISREFVEAEQRAESPRGFAVERLGVGDWPRTDGGGTSKISSEDFEACLDRDSTCGDPVVVAIDVPPDRGSAVIGIAGWRADGLEHIEVVEQQRGTSWVAQRAAEIVRAHDATGVMVDGRGPASSLVPSLEQAGVDVEIVNASGMGAACAVLFDAVDEQTVRHRGSVELVQAVHGAATRPLGDAWAWARKTSGVNIAPLVAVTLALWGLKSRAPDPDEPLIARV